MVFFLVSDVVMFLLKCSSLLVLGVWYFLM